MKLKRKTEQINFRTTKEFKDMVEADKEKYQMHVGEMLEEGHALWRKREAKRVIHK